MSHEVENMMYVSNEQNGRFVPWHGLGVPVEEAPTSADAIRLAGLDWDVIQQPIYTGMGDDKIVIPNHKANVRSTDNKVLGIVTDRYKPVQNRQAFDFTDSLIGEGCVYETAGSLCGGKRVFLLAKMPEKKILEESFDPYICFTNTHDGSGSIKAIMTPVRVVCQNTLSLAIKGATRTWSTRHLGDLQSKLAEAKYTLKMANEYMDKFSVVANQLANTSLSEDHAVKIVEELFPITGEMSDRQAQNITDQRSDFMMCMISPDILKYKGTAYQMVQAASDYATHRAPKRKTSTYQERNFTSVLDGNVVIDTTFLKMMELVKRG